LSLPVNLADVSVDALHLKNMMDGVIERVCSIYQSYNVPLPNKKYWTMGTPVIDCEQVVASFSQLYLGAPGDQASEPQRCNVPRTVTMTVSIARSFPTSGQNGRPPSAETIEKASSLSAIDAWILIESVRLFDMWDDSTFGPGVIATVDVAEPTGGIQLVNMQLTMAVP